MMLFIFYIGCCLGSFCHVVATRMMKEEDFVFSLSHCDYCQHLLSVLDTLPIISYLLLKGKCRYCKRHISSYYLMVEFGFGLASLLLWFSSNTFWIYFVKLWMCCILYIISVIDWKTLEIDVFLLILLAFGSFVLSILYPSSLLNQILGASLISGLLFTINVIVPHSIGEGDLWLVSIVGWAVGLKLTIFAFYIAVFTGTIISLYLLLTLKKSRRDSIAFAPFLCLGFFFAFLMLG